MALKFNRKNAKTSQLTQSTHVKKSLQIPAKKHSARSNF